MKVDLGCVEIYKNENAVVLILQNKFPVREFFKLLNGFSQFFMIQQIEMCTHQVVHAFYINSRFHSDHFRHCIKKIYPSLCITIVLQKITADKCIPAIALVQV